VVGSGLDGVMKTKTLAVTFTLGILTTAVCLAGDAKIEKSIKDLDAQWSAAAAAKNVDKTVSYYSSDAIVLPPNAKAATTKAAIRAQWKGDLDSMIKGSWKSTRVEVAKSGDMACSTGTYSWTYKDDGGKTIKDHGKYLEVWKKQADGSWKCTADCWNSNLPMPGSAPAKKK
jgi:ketosteroid isomerase-like protein